MLGEHHDAHIRMLAPHLLCGLDALGGEGRGHADVQHDHVDRVLGQQIHETGCVGGGGDHLEAGHGVEHGTGTLAHEVVVLGDKQPCRGGLLQCLSFDSRHGHALRTA